MIKALDEFLYNLLHLELLALVVAGVGVVEDDDVEPALLAPEVVTSTAPVLPLSHLTAAPLLPHGLRVVKTSTSAPITFQSKITLFTFKTEVV